MLSIINDKILKKCKDKFILIRVDYNVSIYNGKILDHTRIQKSISIIEKIRDAGAHIILISHLGRPKKYNSNNFRFINYLQEIEDIVGYDLFLIEDIKYKSFKRSLNTIKENNSVGLIENIRLYPFERQHDIYTRLYYSYSICSFFYLYIIDSLSILHRDHATITCFPQIIKTYVSETLIKEINILNNFKEHKSLLILSGGKLTDKLLSLYSGLRRSNDTFLIGGRLSHPFLHYLGYINDSSLVNTFYLINKILKLKNISQRLILPIDCYYLDIDLQKRKYHYYTEDNVLNSTHIYDVGFRTLMRFKKYILGSQFIFINGPIGRYELSEFQYGTYKVLSYIRYSHRYKDTYTALGGGDSISAFNNLIKEEKDTYFNGYVMAGGASLVYLYKYLVGSKYL